METSKSLYGLIGKKLTHSFSDKYFAAKFSKEHINAEYKLFELERIELFPELLLQHQLLQGFNVTIPYKEAILPYLDLVQQEAQSINAVNCINIKNGKLIGYNTDYIGFLESIKPFPSLQNNQALILGTGGAAKAVAYALEVLNIAYRFVSSSQKPNTLQYQNLDKAIIESHHLIINTTPLGMYPDENAYPEIPYNYLNNNHLLYDLIYNPTMTQFLQFGKKRGATILNGYEMLVAQAEASWAIWNK